MAEKLNLCCRAAATTLDEPLACVAVLWAGKDLDEAADGKYSVSDMLAERLESRSHFKRCRSVRMSQHAGNEDCDLSRGPSGRFLQI